MAAALITSPIPQYFANDGTPLNGGYLYFGQSGTNPETSAIHVYFDSALTQFAAQPIRTIGGYPVRDGYPSKLYIDTSYSAYSLTVRDERGALILTDRDVTTLPVGMQPANENLAQLAEIELAAGSFLYSEFDGELTTAPIGAFGLALVGNTDNKAGRTTLGLTGNVAEYSAAVGVQLGDADLFGTIVYQRAATANGSFILPSIDAGGVPENSAILFINQTASKTVTISRFNSSDGIRLLSDNSSSASFDLQPRSSVIMRAIEGSIWYAVASAGYDGTTLYPVYLETSGGTPGGQPGLKVGGFVGHYASNEVVYGDGTAAPSTDIEITGMTLTNSAKTFRLTVTGTYDSGTGAYAYYRKVIIFTAYYNGTTDVLANGELRGAGYTSDATNMPIGAWNAAKVYPVIVGSALTIRFVGRSSAPIGAATLYNYGLVTV